MKSLMCSILLMLSFFTLKSQNLIPNGSFEQYYSCPVGEDIDSLTSWFNPGIYGSPDYYHNCSGIALYAIPSNWAGYQFPFDGAAYLGMYLYWNVGSQQNFREYIEVPLTSSLMPGQCYYFEMYISAGDNFEFTTDAIDVYFSDTLIYNVVDSLAFSSLSLIPQITNNTGMFDTTSWSSFLELIMPLVGKAI